MLTGYKAQLKLTNMQVSTQKSTCFCMMMMVVMICSLCLFNAQVLMAADVELGFNYPERIITVEVSQLHLGIFGPVLRDAKHIPQHDRT
jgi:hypothetical protein